MTATTAQYFNLHTSGVGYLSRVREVKPKKGAAFLACKVSALCGPSDAVEYRPFDCRVSGAEAEKLVRRCIDAVEAEKKVLVGFNIGDIYPDLYESNGETKVMMKGRLLRIDWIKVDGQTVYTAPRQVAETETVADAA
ncbi:MAG TPA: STY4534 family ICE replication protein [Candidatus Thiothrix moscowensis]|uniref:STY4534 family ICE replication protein n=1 Tax=unclassified Thiothrix TaxID=2636184 RepID=UPI0025F9861D|nr:MULTISPECIES: STY4534 family ICE replication protein [unclassified Thiothrix]HRJ52199.1 STY4534 family ICE replication protein [Candidatus Thiothrix moscowensis]HRJ92514.1 STY4534 family ICE replication protein [Candidatus Thiothrix moscowensis]